MVDSETIDSKISDKKEEFDEKKEETKEKYEETKEKGKNIADNVINDLYSSIDEFKEYIKNMQKNADKKYSEYKQATVQTIDIDLIESIESKDTYYIRAAVPGIDKEEISIEAGDNDLTIEATFKPYVEEFEEDAEIEVISSSIKSGRCVKTVRFENSIDLDNITAKFINGIVAITIPKLIIPKHKINVE